MLRRNTVIEGMGERCPALNVQDDDALREAYRVVTATSGPIQAVSWIQPGQAAGIDVSADIADHEPLADVISEPAAQIDESAIDSPAENRIEGIIFDQPIPAAALGIEAPWEAAADPLVNFILQQKPQLFEKTAGIPAQTATAPATFADVISASAIQDSTGNLTDELIEDDYQFPGAALLRSPKASPLLSRLLKQPKLVVGSVIGMCLMASMAYTGLAYWYYVQDTTPTNEAVSLMSIAGDDTQSFLNNLEKLEHEIKEEGQKVAPDAASPEAAKNAKDVIAGKPEIDAFALLGEATDEADQDLLGRADPFAPLVRANGPMEPAQESVIKKDVLESVRFTGFIGDIHSKNKMAIFKVGDAMQGEKTLFKKVGDKFLVEGEPILVTGIAKESVQLKVSGAKRRLSIQEYQELVPAASAGTGTADSSASASAPATTNPANPQLEEAGSAR